MTLPDLLSSALGGLWRQKARSVLTLLGVAVGTMALAYTLALGVGLRDFIENEFKSRREFWRINVHPKNFGRDLMPESEIPPADIAVGDDIPAPRRDRLRQKLVQDFQQNHPPRSMTLITPEQVARLRALPDVDEVRTYRTASMDAALGEARQFGMVYAGRVDDFEPSLQSHLLAGRMPEADGEAVVSEFLLFKLGRKTDEQMRAAVGEKLTLSVGGIAFGRGDALAAILAPGARDKALDLSKAARLANIAGKLPDLIEKSDLTLAEKADVKELFAPKPANPKAPPPLKPAEPKAFTIVGVSRLPDVKKLDPTDLLAGTPMPASDVFVPPAAEAGLFHDNPHSRGSGYADIGLKVKPGGDLEAVVKAIEDGEGLGTFNGLRFYHSVKREVTLISAGLNLFALLSMLVAAIGIMNTLFTSVLERTREIGVLKAVGARDGHILGMFLLEGAAVGVIGGAVGLLAAWLLSMPSDNWVKWMIEHQRGEEVLTKTYFAWPAWLPSAVLLFTGMLTTLAAVFPSRRAARVPPVEALRHE